MPYLTWSIIATIKRIKKRNCKLKTIAHNSMAYSMNCVREIKKQNLYTRLASIAVMTISKGTFHLKGSQNAKLVSFYVLHTNWS